MSGQLQTIDLIGPASYGLNTQDNTVNGDPRFATVASNCVIDEQGRIAARKGFIRLNDVATDEPINQLYTHLKKDGNTEYITAREGEVWRGTTSFTSVHTGSTGNDNWQFASLNEHLLMVQEGEDMQSYNDITWAVETLVVPTELDKPNIIMVGYGRAWAADVVGDDHTVWWSDILNPLEWTIGDSGLLDLQTVFINGKDTITGLAVFNNRLVIFCRKSIYVYEMPADLDPANMVLSDTIDSVGCIARDSIQTVGDDVFFMSESGLMSLSRLFDSNFSFPINNVSRLIQDKFINTMHDDADNVIRSVYYPKEGIYLINSIDNATVFVFNNIIRIPELNLPRVTTWQDTITPIRCFCISREGDLYVGLSDGIYIYSGYGDLNALYRMTFATQWLTFGKTAQLKHLKKVRAIIEGGNGQNAVIRWAIDYLENYDAVPFTVGSVTDIYEWGIMEWNEFEWSGGQVIDDARFNIGNSATAVKLMFQAPVGGEKLSVQLLQVFATQGKTV